MAGIIGFFYELAFTSDESVRKAVFGVLGLLAVRTLAGARAYCLLFGLVYLVVAVWGFALGADGSILGIVPVNTQDSVLHLLLGAGGFGAYAASAPRLERRTARPATT